MAQRLTLWGVLLWLVLSQVGCAREVYDGASTRVDMVIYFHPESTGAEEQEVWTEVLNVPSPRGGYTFAPGIIGVSSCLSPPGEGAICVDFAPNAPQEAIANVHQRVLEWPQVRTVLLDVVPLEVTEADLTE